MRRRRPDGRRGDRRRPAPSPSRRAARVAAWLGAVALAFLLLELFGVDVEGWLSSLWDALSAVDPEYVAGGNSLATVVSVTPGCAGVNQAVTRRPSRTRTWSGRRRSRHPRPAADHDGVERRARVVLVAVAFGSAGRKKLVADSYAEAKSRVPRRGKSSQLD